MSTAPHSRPRGATWKRANLCGLGQARDLRSIRLSLDSGIDCEHHNKRRLKTAQTDSVKSAMS